MRPVPDQTGLGRERAGLARAQKFNGGVQADNAVFLVRIGGGPEGHVGHGKDGTTMGNAHAVHIGIGNGHADTGIVARGFLNGDVQKTDQFIVLGNVVNLVHGTSGCLG